MTEAPTVTVPLQRLPNGAIRVAGTRVGLESIVCAFKAGITPDDIHRRFPTISLADVYAVIGYYLQNQSVIEDYLRETEAAAAALRKEIEADQGQIGWPALRARLQGRLGRGADRA